MTTLIAATSEYVTGKVEASTYATPTPDRLRDASGASLTAYNTLSTTPATRTLTTGEIGGMTFVPGVYDFTPADVTITTRDVILQGTCGDVFIFNVA
jgi:hypothetical protein